MNNMTVTEFHKKRKMFYINELGKLEINHRNESHIEWFNSKNFSRIPYETTIRGYFIDNYMTIYVGDFETPDLNIKFLQYLFEKFPKVEWIGLGCNKGKVGEIWTPKLKISK